jgi:hypothetical protein
LRRLVCCLLAAFLYVASAAGQSSGNTTDDGYFSVYTYVYFDGSSISATASDPLPDDPSYYSYFYDATAPAWSLSGDNYYDSGLGTSFSSGPVPLGSTYTAQFNFLLYVYFSPDGCFYGDDSDACEGTTQQGYDSPTGYASVYVPAPPTIPPDLCAVSSNQAAGFTSIVPSGINFGISGTFSVSFGGSEFSGINPTVAYGPYSTPESIAGSMAALITRNYAQYGLTAKAFGRNVIYSGTATTISGSGTLGLISNVFSGGGGPSSFLADTSPAAANEASMACESSPPPPPTSVCGNDPGTPRAPINVPARITLAKSLLSPQCQNKLAVLPGYTTTKLFSTLSRALFCQYPNTPGNGAYAYTQVYNNTIDLYPNFYPPSLDDKGQAITLIHEGIHLLGRGALPDPTVQNDLGLPVDPYDTHNISDYIARGCYP